MDSTTSSDIIFSEEILRLIKEGDSDERVKEILEESCLHLSADTSGATLLHYCSEYNNANLIQYLVNRGCNVDVQDTIGRTPLNIAIKENHVEALKTLLEAEADIFKFYDEKKSALHMLGTQAPIKGNIAKLILEQLKKRCSSREEIVNKLVDVNCHTYHAIVLKDSWIIETMAMHGISVDSAHPINKIMAIHGAVLFDDLKSVNVLLKYGVDVNSLDAMGESPLFNLYKVFKAHNSEKIEILKTLLREGASIMARTSVGVFQAHNVLINGNRQAIRILIESGLDFNVKDTRSDKAVIHYFAGNTDPGVAEELKQHIVKCQINDLDKHGQTPLFIASYEGNFNMVKFLLENNAMPDIQHRGYGTTPLYCAYQQPKPGFESSYRDCGEILLQYNADPQFTFVKTTGEKVTIFDDALKKNDFDRLKPVIAQLAILEKLGTKIIEIIYTKINSYNMLKEYFDNCSKLLSKPISEKVVLFDLLTCDKRKIARYLANENIVGKLEGENYRCEMQNYQYYYNFLSRLRFQGQNYSKLKKEASKMICTIFKNGIDNTHLIIDLVTEFLDDYSLEQLGLLYLQLPHE